MQRVDEDLPQALLAVLPSDPFDQLDIARRLAAAAYQKRLNQGGSNERVRELERALQDAFAKLAQSIEEQAKLTAERNALVATVKKLNRDVAKVRQNIRCRYMIRCHVLTITLCMHTPQLETFKRTLMQQLQDGDDEDAPGSGAKAQQVNVLIRGQGKRTVTPFPLFPKPPNLPKLKPLKLEFRVSEQYRHRNLVE